MSSTPMPSVPTTPRSPTPAITSASSSDSAGDYPELAVERTPDGTFRPQHNLFPGRFGIGPGLTPPEPGRYHLLGSLDCGWFRRQLIVRRLVGLEEAIPVEFLKSHDTDGWHIGHQPGGSIETFGYHRLNDFYRATTGAFAGRGTSPTIVDFEQGVVVTNDYHTISLDLETAWAPFHAAGAPNLYPEDLRPEIDLLNQQIFDDVNNGADKVLFARSRGAAQAAYAVFAARLADFDFRLTNRRYLLGHRLTDSDVRLYQTLSSYDVRYRPGIAAKLGDSVLHLRDFEHLWAYARDLFQQGFSDEDDQFHLGLIPSSRGTYYADDDLRGGSSFDGTSDWDPETELAGWSEPARRETLTNSAPYSGPGAGGSAELWRFGGRA